MTIILVIIFGIIVIDLYDEISKLEKQVQALTPQPDKPKPKPVEFTSDWFECTTDENGCTTGTVHVAAVYEPEEE